MDLSIDNLKRCILGVTIFFLVGCIASPDVFADNFSDTEEIIEYLILETQNSGLTFIRNGKEYTSEEAASHFRKKYEYYNKKIETPEDFIRLATSKSMISGRKYYVRLDTNEEIPVEEWMRSILEERQDPTFKNTK